MNPMPRATKLALATLLLLPLAALAKTSDRDQPMTVDAASQSGSMLDDNGTIHYAGNVVIVQGSLEVHADAADLYDQLYADVYRPLYGRLRPLLQRIQAITGYPA